MNEYVTDIEGNVYPTVVIGTKTWMAEDLRVLRLNNNTLIGGTTLANFKTLGDASTPAKLTQLFGDINSITAVAVYYNWHAVNTGMLCPTGWHVPTEVDWTDLNNSLNIVNPGTQGGKMKVTGQESLAFWNQPNVGSNNSSGFNGRGNGIINETPALVAVKQFGHWWRSEENGSNGLVYFLTDNNATLALADKMKNNGVAVRCVKN